MILLIAANNGILHSGSKRIVLLLVVQWHQSMLKAAWLCWELLKGLTPWMMLYSILPLQGSVRGFLVLERNQLYMLKDKDLGDWPKQPSIGIKEGRFL